MFACIGRIAPQELVTAAIERRAWRIAPASDFAAVRASRKGRSRHSRPGHAAAEDLGGQSASGRQPFRYLSANSSKVSASSTGIPRPSIQGFRLSNRAFSTLIRVFSTSSPLYRSIRQFQSSLTDRRTGRLPVSVPWRADRRRAKVNRGQSPISRGSSGGPPCPFAKYRTDKGSRSSARSLADAARTSFRNVVSNSFATASETRLRWSLPCCPTRLINPTWEENDVNSGKTRRTAVSTAAASSKVSSSRRVAVPAADADRLPAQRDPDAALGGRRPRTRRASPARRKDRRLFLSGASRVRAGPCGS